MWQYGKFYAQLRELPFGEQPDDEILADDTQLDEWWKSYLSKQAHNSKRGQKISLIHGKVDDDGDHFSKVQRFGKS